MAAARKVDTTALTAAGPRLSPPLRRGTRRAAHDEFGAVAPKFVELTNAVVFDDLWRRSDLRRETAAWSRLPLLRRVETTSSRCISDAVSRAGLTGAQISEAVTHVAFYAGWSKATKAMRAIARISAK